MTTITVVVGKERKPEYKDYVNFLGNYKNGKKDESDSSVGYFSSNSSENGELPMKSFNEYLENYTKNKFQPVKPNLIPGEETKPKNIKTEIFIHVNDTDETETMHKHPHVDDIAKMFDPSRVPNGKYQPKQVHKFQKKIENEVKIPINTLRLNSYEAKQPKKDTKVKSFVHSKQKSNGNVESNSNTNNIFNEKIVLNSSHSANLDKLNGINNAKSIIPHQLNKKNISSEEKSPIHNKNIQDVNTVNGNQLHLSKTAIIINSPNKIVDNGTFSAEVDIKSSPSIVPPPPPPPLPAVTTPKSPKQVQLHSATLPRMVNNNPAKKDTVDSATINRKDPRMKKAAYGALRNMYGAYHNQANEYLATLPKNRVKQGNGLDSIISSIAAQGGLEKLCGRAKVEAD